MDRPQQGDHRADPELPQLHGQFGLVGLVVATSRRRSLDLAAVLLRLGWGVVSLAHTSSICRRNPRHLARVDLSCRGHEEGTRHSLSGVDGTPDVSVSRPDRHRRPWLLRADRRQGSGRRPHHGGHERRRHRCLYSPPCRSGVPREMGAVRQVRLLLCGHHRHGSRAGGCHPRGPSAQEPGASRYRLPDCRRWSPSRGTPASGH